MILLNLVPPALVFKRWQEAREPIAEALARTDLATTVTRVEVSLHNGFARLWEVYDGDPFCEYGIPPIGWGVTYIENGILNVVAWSGKIDHLEATPQMFDYARRMNVKAIRLVGPRAWKRILDPLGFTEVAVILEKKV